MQRSIVVMDPDGRLVRTIHALCDSSDTMSFPYGIDIDSGGRLFVADRGRDQIHVFDIEGHYLLSWGEHGNGPGQFSEPAGICVDGEGRIFVTELGNNRIQVFQWMGTKPVGMASGLRQVGSTAWPHPMIHGVKVLTLCDGRSARDILDGQQCDKEHVWVDFRSCDDSGYRRHRHTLL